VHPGPYFHFPNFAPSYFYNLSFVLQGEKEEFFIAGGFAITNDKSVTDVTVAEAYPLSELDEAAIKTGYSDAVRAASSAEAGSLAQATAQVEANTYQAMARAINVAL
jgi:F0F1-type ATP synthase epsilon subunit